MEQVVLAGTARGLQVPPGVRLYGKTGTADAIGTRDEIVFGVPYNEWGPPNSWFLGIAEDATAEPDQALTPRRVVAAVVVPRGGLGARTAGPAAMEILAAAQALGYITKPVATTPGASLVPGAMVGTPGSPAPGAAGSKTARPVTILAPVLATPTPSPRPPAVAPAASPAAGAPASAPVSPAPAVTPRPAASATPRPSPPPTAPPAAPSVAPAAPAASPSPQGQ
jgi:hypothetical protein